MNEEYGMIKQSEKADLLDRIRPDAIVEVIQNKLMGKEFRNGEWQDNPVLKKRALTEQGAFEIANLMLSVSSQNVSISKLKDDEIRKRTREIVVTAQCMALDNWRDYGIKHCDQLRFIHQIVISNTLITLKQSEGEGIRKLLMGTIQEQSLNQTANNGGGFMSNLFRRKKDE